MSIETPVLIVGAGPTGLSMALELHRNKIPFRIIDKDIKPVDTSNALALQPRTLALWDDIGILNKQIEDEGVRLEGMTVYAGKKCLGSLNTKDLTTLYPYILAVAQTKTEQYLLSSLQERSITVELETELVQLVEKNNHVEAILTKAGEKETVLVDWLIACDGGHSTTREVLRVPFEGKDLSQHFVMGDMEIESELPKNRLVSFFSPDGTCTIVPFNERDSRVLFEVSSDPILRSVKKPTEEQLKELLAKRCPFPIEVKRTTWTSGFWIHEKIIPCYRHNRIFFAGDAAHVHSPAGGQGMNTGMQDAYNLAWKLASIINGIGKPALLDSYNEERRPVAKRVLADSTLMTRLGTLNNKFINYFRNWLFTNFLRGSIGRKMITGVSELSINYRHSKLSKDCIKSSPGPQAGDLYLDCWLDNAKTKQFLSYFKGPKPCILLFSGILRDSHLDKLLELKNDLVKKYGQLFHYVLVRVKESEIQSDDLEIVDDFEQTVHRLYHVSIPTIYVLRPDKYICFRGHMRHREALLEHLATIYV